MSADDKGVKNKADSSFLQSLAGRKKGGGDRVAAPEPAAGPVADPVSEPVAEPAVEAPAHAPAEVPVEVPVEVPAASSSEAKPAAAEPAGERAPRKGGGKRAGGAKGAGSAKRGGSAQRGSGAVARSASRRRGRARTEVDVVASEALTVTPVEEQPGLVRVGDQLYVMHDGQLVAANALVKVGISITAQERYEWRKFADDRGWAFVDALREAMQRLIEEEGE